MYDAQDDTALQLIKSLHVQCMHLRSSHNVATGQSLVIRKSENCKRYWYQMMRETQTMVRKDAYEMLAT